MILAWYWHVILTWYWHDPGMILALYWHYTGIILALYWHGTGMTPIWYWHDTGTSTALPWIHKDKKSLLTKSQRSQKTSLTLKKADWGEKSVGEVNKFCHWSTNQVPRRSDICQHCRIPSRFFSTSWQMDSLTRCGNATSDHFEAHFLHPMLNQLLTIVLILWPNAWDPIEID